MRNGYALLVGATYKSGLWHDSRTEKIKDHGYKSFVSPNHENTQLRCSFYNLVARDHVPFVQHQDPELWNNQFPEIKILGLPVSRCMRAVVYMAWRLEIKSMWMRSTKTYALGKLGKSQFGFERTKQ